MKKIFYTLAIAAVTICACEKQLDAPVDGAENTDPVVQKEYPEIKAVITETKTTITDNGSTFSFAFQVSDEETKEDIAVYNGVKDAETHLPCRYRCTRIEGGVAYFSYNPTSDAERAITPDPDQTEIVALYPFMGTSTSSYEGNGTGTLKFRAVQTLESSSHSFVKRSAPLVASGTSTSPLSFHHTVGMMQLTIKGTGAIKQIVVTSDQKIAGNGYVNYGSSPVLEIYEDVYSDSYKATYNFGEDAGITISDGGVPFYIGLPEGTHNLSITIKDVSGNSMLLSAPSVPISKGVVLPTEITFVADPLSNVTNLSAFGHLANCYVVSAAGNYCFNARKPDGTVVSGDSAVWVWAAGDPCNGAESLPSTMMADVQLSNGKIYFSIPANVTCSTGGNVVLGVIDGSNNVLYTWNIWLTDTALADMEVTPGGTSVTVLDRNLGAATYFDIARNASPYLLQAKGSYYQWGRKDPFVGQRNNNNETTSVFVQGGDAKSSQYYVLNTSLTNVDAWKAAQTFGTKTVESFSASPVYMSSAMVSDASKWSDITNANPCPYGYKVASSSDFSSMISAGSVAVYNASSTDYVAAKLGSGPYVQFPRVGRRRGSTSGTSLAGGIQAYATDARYYVDEYSSSTNAYHVYFKFKKTDGIYGYDGSTTAATTINANNACSVRCVKDI